jgi:hypothetical protein
MKTRFAVSSPKQFAAQVKKAVPSRAKRQSLNKRLFALFTKAEVPSKAVSAQWRKAKALLLNKGEKAVRRSLGL